MKLYQYRGFVKHLERLVKVDWLSCNDPLTKTIWANRVYYAVVEIDRLSSFWLGTDLFVRAQQVFNQIMKIYELNEFSGPLLPKKWQNYKKKKREEDQQWSPLLMTRNERNRRKRFRRAQRGK